jgi:glutamine synthetase
MIREPLAMICTCEMAGRVRGKGFPARELSSRLRTGVGWVPTNTMISAFGPIADTPFGTTGDLILVPDETTRVFVDFDDGGSAEHWFLGDIRHTDGSPWALCPREFLRRALHDLEVEAGAKLVSSFEQEFVYSGVDDRPGSPYSLDSYRRQGLFGEVFTAAQRAAGLEPDSFLPEYGARQFEVTVKPRIGLRAADDAVIVREMARASALRLGHSVSFAPMLDPKGTGNGVHIHFSLRDSEGRPATHDPAGPFGLAPTAQHFVAGILTHLPALCAVTAPATVSYLRLTPNRWAPTEAYVADRDREASLRICPVLDLPGLDPARQLNVEFRAADAAASPYLALGVLVHAGVDGIRRRARLPDPRDVSRMSATERAAAGISPLPRSLADALAQLEATVEARDWFGSVLLDAYLRHKRAEIRMLEGLTEAEQCTRYAQTY